MKIENVKSYVVLTCLDEFKIDKFSTHKLQNEKNKNGNLNNETKIRNRKITKS